MRHIGHVSLIYLLAVLAQVTRADFSTEMAEASTPLAEGVPEVAVVRLQSLLNKSLPEPQWLAVAEKLAEAQVAANEPEASLVLLTDARLRDLPWAKFWRAQALASLHRWADALPLYEELSNDGSPFQKAAVFGAGDTLRALGRRKEALRKIQFSWRMIKNAARERSCERLSCTLNWGTLPMHAGFWSSCNRFRLQNGANGVCYADASN